MAASPQLIERLVRALGQGPAAAAQECAAILIELRGTDQTGAAALVAQDPGLSGLLAAGLGEPSTKNIQKLAAGLETLASAESCVGCGTCCRVSSPTLYLEDAALLGESGSGREHFYTLRAGEEVFSARLGRLESLGGELIKLREGAGGGCIFLQDNGCTIYEQRPLQCRWLECWSGRHAGQLGGRPRLSRADVFAGDDIALALAAEFEQKLVAAQLARLLKAAAEGGQEAGQEALAFMEKDHGLRRGISERYGYGLGGLDLLLGRPAMEIAKSYGLAVELDGEDRPQLRKVR
jgi:Fe-S-cluster containining protein